MSFPTSLPIQEASWKQHSALFLLLKNCTYYYNYQPGSISTNINNVGFPYGGGFGGGIGGGIYGKKKREAQHIEYGPQYIAVKLADIGKREAERFAHILA